MFPLGLRKEKLKAKYLLEIRVIVFLLLIVAVFGYLFLLSEAAFPIILNFLFSTLTFSARAVSVLLLLLLYFFIVNHLFKPLDILKTQLIHKQPSWVAYYFYGLLLAPLSALMLRSLGVMPNLDASYGFSLFETSARFYCNQTNIQNCFANIAYFNTQQVQLLSWAMSYIELIETILRVLIAVFGFLILNNISPKKIHNENWRFSPNSINEEHDRFTWKEHIQWVKNVIVNDSFNNHVSIALIDAPVGEGKSSFARMLVESFDAKKILYTYISLTEVNETAGFSKLFSERWLSALKERYPKLDGIDSLRSLNTILRESGEGVISSALDFLSKLNIGLLGTKARVKDNYVISRSEVSDEVAKIFGNITEINEDLWIVAIDELDRSPRSDVLHVLEIMERFKFEGRSGFPVHVVFFLIADRQRLYKNLNCSDQNSVSEVLKNFFTDTKSFDRVFSPPFINSGRKSDYVQSRVQEIVDAQSKRSKEIIEIINPVFSKIDEKYFEWPEKESERLGVIVFYMKSESIRIIDKVLKDFEGALEKMKPPKISYADLLFFSYIRTTELSYLLEFFKRTSRFLNEDNEDLIYSFTLKEHVGVQKKSEIIIELINSEVGVNVKMSAQRKILKLISTFAHQYFDYFEKVTHSDNYKYMNSTSYQVNLQYLLGADDEIEDERTSGYENYRKIENNQKIIEELSIRELINLSDFVRNANAISVSSSYYYDLAREVLERFKLGSIAKTEQQTGYFHTESEYTTLCHQFAFLVLWGYEHAQRKQKIKDKGVELLLDFLRIEDPYLVDTTAKFIVINAFANHDKSGRGLVDYRFEEVFTDMMKSKSEMIRSGIRSVFEEVNTRYLVNSSSYYDMYDVGENVGHVIFQNWTGVADNTSELLDIHMSVVATLTEHAETVESFWERFPDITAVDLEDISIDEIFSNYTRPHLPELVMPIELLIAITKLTRKINPDVLRNATSWERLIQQPNFFEQYQSTFGITESQESLRHVLRKRGLL